MASFSSGLNPNTVKTALDDVFQQEMNITQHPQYFTAETDAVFKQDTADSSAVIWELFKGAGLWGSRQEEQDVPQGTPRVANQKTFTVTNFAQSIDIPKNMFDDNKHKAKTFSTVLVKLDELLETPIIRAISSQSLPGMA